MSTTKQAKSLGSPIKDLINNLAIQANLEVASNRSALAMISDPQEFGGAVPGYIETTKDDLDALMESKQDKYSDHSVNVTPLASSTLIEFHVYLNYYHPEEDTVYVRYFLLEPTSRTTYRFSELDIEGYEKWRTGSMQRG